MEPAKINHGYGRGRVDSDFQESRNYFFPIFGHGRGRGRTGHCEMESLVDSDSPVFGGSSGTIYIVVGEELTKTSRAQ